MTSQVTPMTKLFNCISFVPCPQFFAYLNYIAHDYTMKMDEDELSAYSASSHNISPALL
jgi:hypothetical protein